MMFVVELIVAELILGAIVGFVLSDNRNGISIEEAKISSILFLLSTAFVFWKNPNLSGTVLAHLAISWFVLIVGVLLGEVVKLRLISKIIGSIQKKDIQLAVNELVQISSQAIHTKRESDMKELYQKLYDVQNMLKLLQHKSKGIKDRVFIKNLHYLFELCEDYVSLSIRIREDIKQEVSSEQTIMIWADLGRELTGLSWDTLNHAEETVKKQLGKAFSLECVHKAIGQK